MGLIPQTVTNVEQRQRRTTVNRSEFRQNNLKVKLVIHDPTCDRIPNPETETFCEHVY